MPLISFIIPAYNSEKTLKRAVESVTNSIVDQTYELLIIDDGSKDNTLALAKQLASQNQQIRILTAGKGVGHARNIGIKHARGQLVAFLDSDDHYLKNGLQKALSQAKKMPADLQIFSFEHGNYTVDLNLPSTNSLDIRCRMLEKPTNYMTVWGKFFKRSLLLDNDIYFNEELTMSEDSEFLIRYTAACESITTSAVVLYHYTIDTPSATRSFDTKKIQAYLKSLSTAEEFVVSQPQAISQSFLSYTLIQVNIIAVRLIYTLSNPAPNKQKRAELDKVIATPVVKRALDQITLKQCLTPHLLPGLFLKLHLASLAILLFKLRSKQNKQKENNS
ncbi:glycosyltransferase family 2 protein [uncultured Ligilactobacillus sp.]|uniref:glycosyltransferase family 2 protein n=1 Tax=uncultured Ligilactobacillus sp. TaxID=2837633 RepID=UPI00272D986C|nr:glycosyltransferase family 2 protein [uncultured Ligilactobacillus sp.]